MKGEFEKRIKGELVELKDFPYPEICTIECYTRLEQCLKWIEEAKKEFPCFNCAFFPDDKLCKTRYEDDKQVMSCELFPCKEWFKKWFGEQNE